MLFWYILRQFVFSKRAGALIRRIAFLSGFAIFLSAMSFLIVLFVMSGMNSNIERRILALEPHLVAIMNKSNDLNLRQQIEANPVFKAVTTGRHGEMVFFEQQDVILRTMEGQFRGVSARGLTSDGLMAFQENLHSLDKKEDHDTPRWVLGRDEVVLGLDLARSLNVFEGDVLYILPPESLLMAAGETLPKTQKVRVGKIIATQLADLDGNLFLYDRENTSLANLLSSSAIQGWEVRWPNESEATRAKEELGQISDLRLETWKDRNSALFFALKMEKLTIGLFLGLAGLIASSSILTVMALLLSQKQRDIALLRVLGLSREDVTGLFTKVGWVLAGSGIVLGVVVATGVGFWIQSHPFDVLPDIYYDSQIPAKVDWRWIVLTLVGAGGIAWIGAWIPTRYAIESEPAEALRRQH